MRRMLRVLVTALLVASCGDALSGVGDLSQRIVYGDQTTTSTSVVALAVLAILGAVGLAVYAGLLIALRAPEWGELRAEWARRRSR